MTKSDQELGRAMYRAMKAEQATQRKSRGAARLAKGFFLFVLSLLCISAVLWMAIK